MASRTSKSRKSQDDGVAIGAENGPSMAARRCTALLRDPSHGNAGAVADVPASLRFDGRDRLRIDEIAKALGATGQHVLDLAMEGDFPGVNGRQLLKLKPAQRMIPVQSWREFIAARYNILHPKNRGTK
jgi:hypothetical protein